MTKWYIFGPLRNVYFLVNRKPIRRSEYSISSELESSIYLFFVVEIGGVR